MRFPMKRMTKHRRDGRCACFLKRTVPPKHGDRWIHSVHRIANRNRVRYDWPVCRKRTASVAGSSRLVTRHREGVNRNSLAVPGSPVPPWEPNENPMRTHGNSRETNWVPMGNHGKGWDSTGYTKLNDDDGQHQCQAHRPAATSSILS